MKLLKIAALVAAVAAKCPFGFDLEKDADGKVHEMHHKPHHRQLQSTARYPSEVLTCSAGAINQTANMTTDNYEAVVKDVINQLNENNNVGKDAACLVRLAGHDFMDFRLDSTGNSSTGGSDGCVNFADADNAGLANCLTATAVQSVYSQWCHNVSLADFVVITAEASMIRTHRSYNGTDSLFGKKSMSAVLRDRFKFGRVTANECSATGLMPDAEKGCFDLTEVFGGNIFRHIKNPRMIWRYIAALTGAHTLGSAKQENSGYEGHWSDAANQGIFNNDFYKSVLTKGWGPSLAVGGNPGRNQWKRIDAAQNSTHVEMMLNSDLCLAYDNNLEHAACVAAGKKNKECRKLQNKGVFLNATNTECCAWTKPGALFNNGILRHGKNNSYCGTEIRSRRGQFRDECCSGEQSNSTGDCDSAGWPKGPAFGAILKYAANERIWLSDFSRAWWIATQKGSKTKRLVGAPKMNKRRRKHIAKMRKDLDKQHNNMKDRIKADAKKRNDQRKANMKKGNRGGRGKK